MTLSRSTSVFFIRKDVINIVVLILIAVLIFYPLFYSEYLYTDDWVQLWMYKKGSGFHMFITQGRFITALLFEWLFSQATTARDVLYIRLFSFLGWLTCIPIWYVIIKRIVEREELPALLVFFSVLYLICTPSFSVYVRWASCLEQFIAYTSGLLSGYVLYASIESESGKISRPLLTIPGSLMLGIISLFTYQNGLGCFLLPFLLHFISQPKKLKVTVIAVAIYLSIYVVYYLLFKLNLQAYHLQSVERTTVSTDIFAKIRFFFRPLASAFHFTVLFNEKSITGFAIYVITFLGWVVTDFYRRENVSTADRLQTFILTIFLLTFIYLPSLVVKENYFSNRTLFALDMAVFFLVANTVLNAIRKNQTKTTVIAMTCFLFVLNARYNFAQEFLNPVKTEYKQVRTFIEANYEPRVAEIYFIRPHQDFFVRKFGVTRSWDEFGVPSTFFDWVPEFFTRQVIFEKTGDRKTAENLTIKSWLGKEEYLKQNPVVSPNTLLVDVEEILNR